MSWDDEFEADRPSGGRPKPERREQIEAEPKKARPILLFVIFGAVILLAGVAVSSILIFRADSQPTQYAGPVRGPNFQPVQPAFDAFDANAAQMAAIDLRSLGEAIRSFEASHGRLPSDTFDPAGKPLLSWRVHLLPFVGEADLYREFKLNESWSSPANRRLRERMPQFFAPIEPVDDRFAPGAPPANPATERTYYRAFSHPGAAFEKPRDGKPIRISLAEDFPDGSENTILVVESGELIEWTRPDGLEWPAGKPRPALGGRNLKAPFFVVVMADGQARRIRREIPDDDLRALIGRNDRRTVPPKWLADAGPGGFALPPID